MISLPNITLVAMTGKNIPEHIKALKESSKGITWGKILLLSPEPDSVSWGNRTDETEFGHLVINNKQIAPIESIDDWNRKIIQDLWKYVDTSHALLIHQDGGVLHPESWQDKWMEYDYCGSPWPLPTDDYSYRTPSGRLIRVGNSVSLRSKRLMELTATRKMEYHYGNNNEDGEICVWQREWLESQGCKFMPFEEAIYFGKEVELPEHKGIKPFVYHTVG